MTTKYTKTNVNFFDQGKTFVTNKLKKISQVFTSGQKTTEVEGFSGILGANAPIDNANTADYTTTRANVAVMTDNLAQYTTANKNHMNKSTDYLVDVKDNYIGRNYNMFVSKYSDANIDKFSRCVSTAKLTDLPTDVRFAAAYPALGSGNEMNFTSFEEARNACNTWGSDSAKGVFALTQNPTTMEYECRVGDNNQTTVAQYTKQTTAYALTGAASSTANKGGLFSNGLIGVYTKSENVVSKPTPECVIANMPAPYKQTRFDNPANNPWFQSSYWGYGFIPDPTAFWIWPNSNAPSVMGYSPFYMYYNYKNTKSTPITAKVYCVADNYADLNLNGQAVFTKIWAQVPLQTVTLQPGSNFFELRAGNAGGPGAIVLVVQADLGDGTGMKTLFKTGDADWGVASAKCTNAQMVDSNSPVIPDNPTNIKYFSGYDLNGRKFEQYRNCDPLNGGDIFQPSISATFGRNCSNRYEAGMTAQYIRVKNRPEGNNSLQIAQLVAMGYDNGQLTNLAFKGRTGVSATASSTWSHYGNPLASNAIDGIQQAKSFPNIFHSMGVGPDEYWQVDLGKPYLITQVFYYNRGDCCSDRAAGMTIELWNTLPSSGGNPLTTYKLTAAMRQEFNITRLVNNIDCNTYQDSDINLPKECTTKLWNAAGCTVPPTEAMYTSWNTQSKKSIISAFADAAAVPHDAGRTLCYGTDKTKWPALDTTKYKQVVGLDGNISCEHYCQGYSGVSWNNELPDWKGAVCEGAGPNNDPNQCRAKGHTKCMCKRTDNAPFYAGPMAAAFYRSAVGMY